MRNVIGGGGDGAGVRGGCGGGAGVLEAGAGVGVTTGVGVARRVPVADGDVSATLGLIEGGGAIARCVALQFLWQPGDLVPTRRLLQRFRVHSVLLDGRGYVIEWSDGMYSKSGGIQGSCSHHQGNGRTLYSS